MQIKILLGFIWKLDMLGIAHHLQLAFALYLQRAIKTQELLSHFCDCCAYFVPDSERSHRAVKYCPVYDLGKKNQAGRNLNVITS